MSFKLESLPSVSARPAPFAKYFQFKAGTDERDQVVAAVKRAKANQCRIYVLKDDAASYGFIAISLAVVGDEELPMLVLDYMLVSLPYRGLVFKELGGLKVADFLLAQVLRLAMEINHLVPVRYVGLEPANEELNGFYQRRDYKKLDNTHWLFMVLPKPS